MWEDLSLYHGEVIGGVKVLLVNDIYHYRPTSLPDGMTYGQSVESCYEWLQCCDALRSEAVQIVKERLSTTMQVTLSMYDRTPPKGMPSFKGVGYQRFTGKRMDIDEHLLAARKALRLIVDLRCYFEKKDNNSQQIEFWSDAHLEIHKAVYFLKRLRWKIVELHHRAPKHHQLPKERE